MDYFSRIATSICLPVISNLIAIWGFRTNGEEDSVLPHRQKVDIGNARPPKKLPRSDRQGPWENRCAHGQENSIEKRAAEGRKGPFLLFWMALFPVNYRTTDNTYYEAPLFLGGVE